MIKQIINSFSIDNIFNFIAVKLDSFEDLFDSYLSHTDNLKVLSVIMIALGIILFVFWVAIVISKYLGLMLGGNSSAKKEDKTEDAEEDTLDETVYDTDSRKESSQAQKKKAKQQELDELEQQKIINALVKEKLEQEEENKKIQQKKLEKEAKRTAAKNDNVLDLDWKKGKGDEIEKNHEQGELPNLKYQQSKKKLSELVGLIIDMLGRNVDELKIAQTVMFRNMGQSTEDEILQTIEAVKDFIAMCINKRFDKLLAHVPLPSIEEALFHLANGDPSLALALVETRMDNDIERAAALPLGDKRNEVFMMTSHYAVTFGNLSALSDIHLATGAFELAIELYPQNVNAWSRIGDLYTYTDVENKAVWAYKNVLSLGDEEINARSIANANRMLSQYYYKQGDSLQAAKMYNSSRGYYDSIGINRRPDRQEVEIIELIERKQKEKLQDTIIAVLNNQRLAQYSFI